MNLTYKDGPALKGLTLKALDIFIYKPWRPKGFIQFKIIINVLVISFRVIRIPMFRCYGSTTIINICTLTVVGCVYNTSDSDVYRR